MRLYFVEWALTDLEPSVDQTPAEYAVVFCINI